MLTASRTRCIAAGSMAMRMRDSLARPARPSKTQHLVDGYAAAG